MHSHHHTGVTMQLVLLSAGKVVLLAAGEDQLGGAD